MNNIYLTPVSWVVLIFIISILLGLLYLMITTVRKEPSNEKYNKFGKPGEKGVCAVCGTIMSTNERMISAVYPGEDDRLCYIYGCPNCYPVEKKDIERFCPICKHKIGEEDHLIARYFERKDGTNRIHILGCNKCKFKK